MADCFSSYDVSDKKDSKIISRISYEGATFTHQGWVNNLQWQGMCRNEKVS